MEIYLDVKKNDEFRMITWYIFILAWKCKHSYILIICCGWMTSKYPTFCLNFYGVFCILLTSVSISSNFSLIFWSRRPIMLFKRFGGAADQRSRRRSGGKGEGASEILISGRFFPCHRHHHRRRRRCHCHHIYGWFMMLY